MDLGKSLDVHTVILKRAECISQGAVLSLYKSVLLLETKALFHKVIL